MRAVKHILFAMLLLAALTGFAQLKNLNKANNLFLEKKIDSARVFIDSAAVNPETSNEYFTWLLRGFIYKELYKTKESQNPASPLRDQSVEYLKKADALLTDTAARAKYQESVRKSLKYIAAQYHNDIAKTLDTLHYEQSLKNAEKYKDISKYLDPNFDDKAYEYDIDLIIGTMFEKVYEQNDSKTSLDLAKVYLFKAHELKPGTFSVNKNIGFLYYNQAVTIIKKMDYDIPLDQLPVYQDQSIKLARQAEPYCLKAHELDPNDKAVIEALAGIYYLLNETEKHNEYKKKLEGK